MTHLILFSNHLNESYIQHVDPDKVTVLVSQQQFEFVSYHQFRILYHISAAFHFAKEHQLTYVYKASWDDFFATLDLNEDIIMYEQNDVWMKEQIKKASTHLKVTLKRDINFYFQNIEQEFNQPPYKLDHMYRRWRKKFDILMDQGKPIGGRFSHDSKNRKAPPKTLDVQAPLSFELDDLSLKIYADIQKTFANNPSSNQLFTYPLTKEDASALLDHFIYYRLAFFGQYQDAMMDTEPYMVHSLISASINLGLLMVHDVVKKVIQAYYDGLAPIEAVEGFIRQVIGWREYIRGIYLIEMKEDYHLSNKLNHTHAIPSFFYDSKTSLFCLHTVIKETINTSYNHHIQRLMIIGNIANLMGISPQGVRQWFNEMYIDSFDWVVTPNVIGMALYADGGKMSTKPYISSANYINKMSNYCRKCMYNPKVKTGKNACPVNGLYYTFLHRHIDALGQNPRMAFMYMNYHKLSKQVLQACLDRSQAIIKNEGVH